MTAIFLDFFYDFMRNSNFGIGVIQRQILTGFFVTSFLCSLKFLLLHMIGHTKKY